MQGIDAPDRRFSWSAPTPRGLQAECLLFLTAQDSVVDRVAAITGGADEYISKPFSTRGAGQVPEVMRRCGIVGVRSQQSRSP